MVEVEQIRMLSSVHILLPERFERRLERWTKKMPGASWPAWGGHVTLVPNFIAQGPTEEIRAKLTAVCAQEAPFPVRLSAPISVQDTTRPDYCAVFLTVEDGVEAQSGEDQRSEAHRRLHALRNALLVALEPLRKDVLPALVEMPFLPHVTLALGVGEVEAAQIVQAMRAEPLVAEFMVEVIWLFVQTVGDLSRFHRYLIPLGKVAQVELLRD